MHEFMFVYAPRFSELQPIKEVYL